MRGLAFPLTSLPKGVGIVLHVPMFVKYPRSAGGYSSGGGSGAAGCSGRAGPGGGDGSGGVTWEWGRGTAPGSGTVLSGGPAGRRNLGTDGGDSPILLSDGSLSEGLRLSMWMVPWGSVKRLILAAPASAAIIRLTAKVKIKNLIMTQASCTIGPEMNYQSPGSACLCPLRRSPA